MCPEGQWGGECRGSCDCNKRGDCSSVDGSCDCDPGWIGDSCEMSKSLLIYTVHAVNDTGIR